VSGALAERDFVNKLERVGFTDVTIPHRHAFGIEDCELYPLFTDDLVQLMRDLIPPERQHAIATSIVIKACLTVNGPATERESEG
jgi:arsenite methyltransferase